MRTNPKVSVLLQTYNHEEFVAQAIDSVLMQTVRFDHEIIIGEDCSTDATRDIVVDFQRRYPDKISSILPEKNLGFGGNALFERLLRAARGQYIALLEGDDYWTTPHKLQKQVDFLDSHPECAICFHNAKAFYHDGSQPSWNYNPTYQKKISTLEDLLITSNFIATCATMFRRGLFGKLPDWSYPLVCMDWVLHVLNAQYGKIGYIDEVMGAYRIHSGGLRSMKPKAQQIQEVIETYERINAGLNFKYMKVIEASISERSDELAIERAKAAEAEAQREWQTKGISHQQLVRRIREVVRNILPPDATVIIVGGRTNVALLPLEGRRAWHFPQSKAGESEELFAGGARGSQEAVWVDPYTTYEFRLYAGTDHETLLAVTRIPEIEQALALATPSENMRSEGAFVTANPNPVPTGAAKPGTTISWSTGDDSQGEVYVTKDPSYYSISSTAAIEQLKELRSKGGNFLLFPSTALWWLEHYRDFSEYLDSHYQRIWSDQCGIIYQLSTEEATKGTRAPTNGGVLAQDSVVHRFMSEAALLLGRKALSVRLTAWIRKMIGGAKDDGESRRRLGASPSSESTAAQLTASPNPVPPGPSSGTTIIRWDTGDGSPGQVYLFVEGKPEQLFAGGPRGTQEASWINAGTPYEFRLYAGTERETLLATTTVNRSAE